MQGLFSRYFFIPVLTFLLISDLRGQIVADKEPLFSYACEVDTDCVNYSRNHVHVQVDSVFDDKGGWTYTYEAHYDDQGHITHSFLTESDFPDVVKYHVLRYNKNGMCTQSRECRIRGADTISIFLEYVNSYDSVKGVRTYTQEYPMRKSQVDTTAAELLLKYTDGKSSLRWAEGYTNRYVITERFQKRDDVVTEMTLIGMHDKDTLYINRERYTNDSLINDASIWLWDGSYSEVKSVNQRVQETKTFQNNSLVAHCMFVDSTSHDLLMSTSIYNLLVNDSVPEIVATYSDSLLLISKKGLVVLEDHQPTYERKVYHPIVEDKWDHMANLERIFPYVVKTPLAKDVVKIEYYDFRSGYLKPLLIIVKNTNGICYTTQMQDMIIKRTVRE